MEGFVRKEAQRVACAFLRLTLINPAAFGGNTKRRQTKTRRGNARNVTMILIQTRPVYSCAVRHQTRLRISLFPKIIERAVLEVFEE